MALRNDTSVEKLVWSLLQYVGCGESLRETVAFCTASEGAFVTRASQ